MKEKNDKLTILFPEISTISEAISILAMMKKFENVKI
jgi:hypothetical protein